MKQYIEQLKKYWESNDLSFIATLTKINDNHGYFNNFINPKNKKRLFYPTFDGIEIMDRRISFFYGNVQDMKSDDYYKVQLEYTNNPKGKNNPYALKIKNVTSLSQEKIKEFLKDVLNKEIYYGYYTKKSDTFALFENVMHSDTGSILLKNREILNVYVDPKILLEEKSYYSFSIKENSGKLPSVIPNTIKPLRINPYKDFIRLRFERLNNPEANKMIANLMREIGKGMYSSKQRMIFELLQNADDAPGKEKVEFHIDISGDYFFVMHDGAPFNKDDVEAITSAAESTKRGDSKKTGYKGIGFKSVFTDSTEVWLKSGGYQFAFLRNSSHFDNFDNFYFSGERYTKYPELLEEDKLKYRNQRLRFNGSTDIPWQVIPIWQEDLPNEFNDSNFNNFNNPVQFALKLGERNIEDYKVAIDNITKRPQFLLFLRNTSKFRSPKNGVTVLREDSGTIIKIIKSKRDEQSQIHYYTKQTFENIDVSDEAFAQLNIGLRKQSKINDYNEVTYYFTDLEGREIETIPPKLASANETEISFGILLIDDNISPEQEYLEGLPKYSSLFTYLPMEDTRFQLPFLVNADFVPSSDRQRIQGDNLWNKYIMIKVAEKHVEILAFYALEFIKDITLNSSYLSLLLKNLLPEDETAQHIIDSYNNKYLEHLKSQEIVVNDNNQTQLLADTILDDSGLIELFGHDMFYKIIETDKRLPHSNLEISYIKDYDYLGVEVIDLEQLAKQITPEICENLGVIIAQKSLYHTSELLKWLNKLVKYIPDDFGKIPFIVHSNALFSLERLVDEADAWLINENTSQYQELFKELGYHTINLNLDKYSNIKEYLHTFRGYLNDKTLAYERIASSSKLSNLPIATKLSLIDFLQNSTFMAGIGQTRYFSELELFIDECGKARALRQLLGRQESLEVNSILKFRITETEYANLPDSLKKELIAKNKIFTSFIFDEELFNEWSLQFDSENISDYVTDLKTMYTWVENTDEISSADWASITWVYIDDETRFMPTDKVYWSSAFDTLSTDNYETIKSLLHGSTVKTLPLQACGDIIHSFKLKTENSSDIDWTKVKELDVIVANTLLDWMENDGNFSDFFKKYTFKVNENGLYFIQEIEDIHLYDGSDTKIGEYIQSIEKLSSLFIEFDENLCSEDRNKIGLLQGDKLLKAIIDSGAYDQSLAVHLPVNTSSVLLQKFISNLDELKLKTTIEYNSSSPEHLIINHLLRSVEDINAIPTELQNAIESLRSKITINDNPLANYSISDRVSFGTKEDRKLLRLSDILTEFRGDSDELENVKESFTGITQKEKLRKLIFKTIPLKTETIHSKIEAENTSHYSIYQVVFMLLDKAYGGKRNWKKMHFDDYYKTQGDEIQLQKSYQLFLDIIFELDFSELSDFDDLLIENCVDKNFAVEAEFMPDWLENWINKNQVKRLAFISKLGYNGITSPIVELRKAAVAEKFDNVTVIGHYAKAKQNTQVIWNTIKWLSNYSSEIITRNIELITQINDFITLSANSSTSIIIPIIESISNDGNRVYNLKSVTIKSHLYFLQKNEEFEASIFAALKRENENLIFIDNACGKMSAHFNVEIIKLSENINIDLLQVNSKLWDEPFYKKWEYYSKYPIYIYEGEEIPYLRTYRDIIINEFTRGLNVDINSKFYLSRRLKTDILNNLPPSFPANIVTQLKEWHYKTLQNESLLDEDSFDYKEDIDRLLQDRLGISEEAQKQESGNAKTHAVYFLDENGYDVSNVNNAGAALTNIVDPSGNLVKCVVRSAKGGLLYLDKEHWDMLEDNLTYLIVIYPGNSPRLFKDRVELLEEELAENILFRVPNNKFASEIDGVFNALESESHLILVTSEKMKESLFSKLKKKGDVNKEESVAIGGDDFTF